MRVRLAFGFYISIAALLMACGSSQSGPASGINTGLPPAGGGGNGSAVITWNGPSTNADSTALADLAGYRVYQSATSGSYTSGAVATVTAAVSGGGTATVTVNNLAPGTYYFVVRAYDSSGNESVYSNEASKTIP
jgi:hypothetical protein